MLLFRSIGLFLPLLFGIALWAPNASGVVLYRIGMPFSAAEKDSLESLGVDFREISWSASPQLQDALEVDSLAAGSLQPNFFDEDEDIAASLLERGGWVRVNIAASDNDLVGLVLIDQDPNTAYTWQKRESGSINITVQERTSFNLGGEFLIREIRFRPLADKPEHFLDRFRIGVSDPGFATVGSGRIPFFPTLFEIEANSEPDIVLPLDPPITTSYVQLVIVRESLKEVGLASFELFGGGFVSRSSYETDIIELDDNASWGEIRWSGRRDPEARIELRTRTGADLHPDIFWEMRTEQQDSVRYLDGGGDLSFTEYKKRYDSFIDHFKPSDPEDWVSNDTENWSFWSRPYPFDDPGIDIASPGPRRYIQLKADFFSTVEDGGKIDYIEFKASVPPSVHSLTGEIFPILTEIGEPTRFTYYIRPTIRAGDSGFDGVEIATPSGIISVDSLRIDGVNIDDFSATIKPDRLGFEVLLPRHLEPTDSGALVEIVFNALVLQEVGTRFQGKIFNTATPNEVRQQISPGNAADEIESDLLSVQTTLTRSLLFSPQLSPNPFTPNGDNINDRVDISYSILRVTAPVPVSIEIFDLSGRLVKQVYTGDDPIGEFAHSWDGKNGAGELVPPGLYLYQIRVDLQSGQETEHGVVAVVY